MNALIVYAHPEPRLYTRVAPEEIAAQVAGNATGWASRA
jgi:putative NADPH-quinone reductase